MMSLSVLPAVTVTTASLVTDLVLLLAFYLNDSSEGQLHTVRPQYRGPSPEALAQGLVLLCCVLFDLGLPGVVVVAAVWAANQQSWMDEVARLTQVVEEKEQAIQRVTAVLAIKRNFLTTMTHELRTPMHGIISMSGELKGTLASDPQVNSAVHIISDCADHLISLVDNILDFEKLESLQLELERIPFSIAQEITKALGIVKASAEKKKVRLDLQQSIFYPIHVGDPMRFRQVALNLLSNAIKFTPEGGSVSISILNDNPTNPAEVSVLVGDTGVGIAAEHTERLFSRFSQADSSVSRKYGGSGLGLAICKRLCENMGGSIACESQVGKGSTFRFSVHLPVADEAGTSPLHSSDGPESVEGLRVLLVEDNHVNQMVGERMLSHLGCSARVAANGAECLSILEHDRFDLILMDCNMPVLDGFQTTREIRRREGRDACNQIPVLALTASATKEQAKRCMDAGMSEVLFKPLRRATLQAALSKWTRVGTSTSAAVVTTAPPLSSCQRRHAGASTT